MKAISNHMPAFLKHSFQKIRDKRENWNASLQESLQELEDPPYEKAAQALVEVLLRFFLLQVRLVSGVILFLLSTIFLRGVLESLPYLPLGLLFFFFSCVCLILPFRGSAFKPWREVFLTVQFKRLTLKLLLQVAFLCISFRTAWYMLRMVGDFFGEGISG